MCDRYALHIDGRALAGLFGVAPPCFDRVEEPAMVPGQHVPVVRTESGRPMIDVAHWGLIPGWVEDPNLAPRPALARAEELEAKATFRSAFRRKRCLIPASGFYGGTRPEKAAGMSFFHPAGGGLFAFAGLLEDWQGPHGEIMFSTCLITTEANSLVSGIQARMPAILPKAAWQRWLDPAAQTREVAAFLRPLPASQMALRAGSPG